MPSSKSVLHTQVDGIGYATVFAYGMVIPMFLLMVMARQHLALQESRLLVATADIGKHTRALRIERLRRTSEETPEPTTELGAGLKEWTGVIGHGDGGLSLSRSADQGHQGCFSTYMSHSLLHVV